LLVPRFSIEVDAMEVDAMEVVDRVDAMTGIQPASSI
jgi:hypothetical protein